MDGKTGDSQNATTENASRSSSSDSNSSTNSNSPSQQMMRKELIDVAVQFLSNPKVVSKPEDQKKEFLTKKGLTYHEIQAAINQANLILGQNAIYPRDVHFPPPLPVQQYVPPPPSIWVRFRDYSSWVIFLAGFAYGCHYIYKRYIGPFLTGKKSKTVEEIILDTQKPLLLSMENLQIQLQEINRNILESRRALQDSANPLTNIGEIQNELSCVKGLLLNRKSFPTTPQFSIPHWQRISKPNEETTPTITVAEELNGETTPILKANCETTPILKANCEETPILKANYEDTPILKANCEDTPTFRHDATPNGETTPPDLEESAVNVPGGNEGEIDTSNIDSSELLLPLN